MGIVKGWKKEEWGNRIDVKLYDTVTRNDVWWSPVWSDGKPGGARGGANSYVLAEVSTGPTQYTFKVDGKDCLIFSVNGHGEVRWDVTRADVRRALEWQRELGRELKPGDGIKYEALGAARHFGVLDQVEGG